MYFRVSLSLADKNAHVTHFQTSKSESNLYAYSNTTGGGQIISYVAKLM